jgi:hypothetical protein
MLDRSWSDGTELTGAWPPATPMLKADEQGVGEGKIGSGNRIWASSEGRGRRGGRPMVMGGGHQRCSSGEGLETWIRGEEVGSGCSGVRRGWGTLL